MIALSSQKVPSFDAHAISLYLIPTVISRPPDHASSSLMRLVTGLLSLSNATFLNFHVAILPSPQPLSSLDFPFNNQPCHYHQLQPLCHPNVKHLCLTSPANLFGSPLLILNLNNFNPPFLQPTHSTTFPSILKPFMSSHSCLFTYPTWISWYLLTITPCRHTHFLGKSQLCLDTPPLYSLCVLAVEHGRAQ